MATTVEMVGFEHNGFKCTITERPDLCYLYMVHGYRQSDDKDFLPNAFFVRNLTAGQIKDACIAMMDGIFSGRVERYGNYNVVVGI